MNVTITMSDLGTLRDEGTVWVVTGTDNETGDLVTFAGDHRPMANMLEGLAGGEQADVMAEIEDYQVVRRQPLRRALVARSAIGGPTGEVVASYLPANYKVAKVTETEVTVMGHDSHGWTLDDYVIPRLASGLISAKEVRS